MERQPAVAYRRFESRNSLALVPIPWQKLERTVDVFRIADRLVVAQEVLLHVAGCVDEVLAEDIDREVQPTQRQEIVDVSVYITQRLYLLTA